MAEADRDYFSGCAEYLPADGMTVAISLREARTVQGRNLAGTAIRKPMKTLVTDWLHLVQAEYQEMPGLNLTKPQVQRLWGFDEPTCTEALDTLEAEQFLKRTPRAATSSLPSTPDTTRYWTLGDILEPRRAVDGVAANGVTPADRRTSDRRR